MIKTKLVLSEQTTFNDALTLLDRAGNGILCVVDRENRLLGIITDGDVRRAILRNDLTLEGVINFSPESKHVSITRQEANSFLRSSNKRHLPLIDNDGTLVDLYILNSSEVRCRENTVVIMAGGLGSRLGDLTKEVPKPMLPVGGKPILQTIIESLSEQGFGKFLISINYLGKVIEDHFGDGSDYGVNIDYLRENKRLGTAGALKLLENRVENDFIVVNGDVLTDLNFENFLHFHMNEGAVASMCVRKYKLQVPYGVIESEEGRIIRLKEKPCHDYYVNTGIYALSHKALSFIPDGQYYDMTSLFSEIISNRLKASSYKMNDVWVDIGHVSQYEAWNKAFSLA